MQKVVEFLQANPVQYLATVGRDGKAKCRPFMFCFEQDGKLWFCTNNTKDVYKDMIANPEIEISVSSPEYAWIRLHGKAVFEDNKSVKEGPAVSIHVLIFNFFASANRSFMNSICKSGSPPLTVMPPLSPQ